jgi:hypothetical protein
VAEELQSLNNILEKDLKTLSEFKGGSNIRNNKTYKNGKKRTTFKKTTKKTLIKRRRREKSIKKTVRKR